MHAMFATVVYAIEPRLVIIAGGASMPGHDSMQVAHQHIVVKIIGLGGFSGKNIEEDEAVMGEGFDLLVLGF